MMTDLGEMMVHISHINIIRPIDSRFNCLPLSTIPSQLLQLCLGGTTTPSQPIRRTHGMLIHGILTYYYLINIFIFGILNYKYNYYFNLKCYFLPAATHTLYNFFSHTYIWYHICIIIILIIISMQI